MTPSRRALTRVRLGQRRRGPLELPEKHNFPVPQSSSLFAYHCISPLSLRSSTPLLTFSSSSPRLKKPAKDARSEQQAEKAVAANTSVDPYDFSTLQTGIEKAHAALREDLAKLRGGGKLGPEAIESLKVKVDKTGTERLSNVAQVIPRGRTLQVIVGDKDYVKPISSAILSSNLNLTPQPDQQNAQQLNINLPPPTTEARTQAVQAAQRAADAANTAIRNARGIHQKALRTMQVARTARPDDIKKAGDRMEKVVEAGGVEVKKIVDSAKRVLQGG